jgi:hypothetical protein
MANGNASIYVVRPDDTMAFLAQVYGFKTMHFISG